MDGLHAVGLGLGLKIYLKGEDVWVFIDFGNSGFTSIIVAFVRKGPSFSINTHLRFELSGGCQCSEVRVVGHFSSEGKGLVVEGSG